MMIENAFERIIIEGKYCDIPMGLYLIRGENVMLMGELVSWNNRLQPFFFSGCSIVNLAFFVHQDLRRDHDQTLLKRVSPEEIFELQRVAQAKPKRDNFELPFEDLA
jgi:U6 snRNA-associated Sm-like protein LSm1